MNLNFNKWGASLLLLLLTACGAPTPEEAYRDNLSEVWKVGPYRQMLGSMQDKLLQEKGQEGVSSSEYAEIVGEFVEEELPEVLSAYCEPEFRKAVGAQEMADFAQLLNDSSSLENFEMVYGQVDDFEKELDTISVRIKVDEAGRLQLPKVVMMPLSIVFKERCDTLYQLCGGKIAQDFYKKTQGMIRTSSNDSLAIAYVQNNLPMLFLNGMNNRLSEKQLAGALPVCKVLVKFPAVSADELYERACLPAFRKWMEER